MEIPEQNIHISEGGKTTADKVVERALLHLMTQTRDMNTPVALAAVHVSYLTGYASAAIHLMDNAPDWLASNPAEGLAILTKGLRDDLLERESTLEWLQEIIEMKGFVGWAFLFAGEVDGQDARVLTFYSRAQGIFSIWEVEGDEKPHSSWMPDGALDGHPAQLELECTIAFNELTHFARIRWEQYGVPVCGPEVT